MTVYQCYPLLFKEEQQKQEDEKRKKQTEIYAAQWKLYAQKFNIKHNKDVGEK